MKKNKTIAYMLAATLLVGGTFVGTKALFTASDISNNDLVITMGDVAIEVKEDDKWTIKEHNGEAQETQVGSENFTYLKTNDILAKKITIENKGTLYAKINSIEFKGTTMNLPRGIEFSAESLMDLQNEIIAPGDSIEAELQLKVVDNHIHGEEGSLNQSENVNISLKNVKYVINAQQITKTEYEQQQS